MFRTTGEGMISQHWHKAAILHVIVALAIVQTLVGCTQPIRVETGQTVVLYSARDPVVFRARCPDSKCVYFEVSDVAKLDCREPRTHTKAVIISGEGSPPDYLNVPAEDVARALRCFDGVELVVIDTCYGMSLPILEALSQAGVRALVVGATYKLPPEGFEYEAAFFEPGPASERARYVRSRSGRPVEHWSLANGGLSMVRRHVDAMNKFELLERLTRKNPNFVLVALPGAKSNVLVEVPPQRFRE